MLHLLGARALPMAGAVIAEQVAAGHTVIAVLLPGAAPGVLPPHVRLHRVSADMSYGQLLDLVFEADRVVTW